MPQDRWGIPYLYAPKIGGFYWEQKDDIAGDSHFHEDGMTSSSSSGSFTIHFAGPTSPDVFSDPAFANTNSIGGCGMNFAQTESRGYIYKPNDPRDIEFKMIANFGSGFSNNGFSISGPTGEHSSDGCCSGYSYMFNMEPDANPCQFRFRKEMWHVSYHSLNYFSHPSINFKLTGHGNVGVGYIRYNKKDGRSAGKDSVVLEGWMNPNPDTNPQNWIMIGRVEDKTGWGNDGDHCNGAKDQVGTWGGPKYRIKSNAPSANITFKHLSLREIDPTRSFDDDPTTPPPPPPTTVTRQIVYAMVTGSSGSYTGWTTTTGHEIVEAQTDPDPFKKFQQDGFFIPSNGEEIADVCGSQHTYADGLTMEGYWSNNDAGCVVPHIFETDLGGSTLVSNPNGGPVLTNAKIYLIFWGTDWATRGTTPTMTGFTDLIQNKLLGTDKEYFTKLSQYGQIQAPTWGGAVSNTTFPVPSGSDINDTMGRDVLTDTFNKGLLAVPNSVNQDIYILLMPVGKNVVTANNSSPNGFHDIYKPTITIPAIQPPPPPPPSGDPTTIQGSFRFQQDVNTSRGQSACAGTTVGGGGGTPGTLAKFYSFPPDNDKELSDSDLWQHRTRIVEQVKSSGSAFNGKIVKQIDIPLKKVGSPGASPGVHTKIYSSGGNVIYDCPTVIDPTTLTTSFVYKTFDWSTNTHTMVVGDRIGVQYGGTSDIDYIVVGEIGQDILTATEYQQYEGYPNGIWDVKSRELAMDCFE